MEILNEIKYLKNHVKKIYLKNDPAHDFEHIMRVYKNAEKICKTEKANKKLVLISVLLHDIVKVQYSSKNLKSSADASAEKSEIILKQLDMPEEKINVISEAIRNHSFTKKRISNSIEGRILQDADRLDAIGSIGISRAFCVSGVKNRPFYNPDNPFAKKRRFDDKRWALDHFFKKLLMLEKQMNTKSATIEAKRRTKILRKFLDDLRLEI